MAHHWLFEPNASPAEYSDHYAAL